jgi:hypothetical protein
LAFSTPASGGGREQKSQKTAVFGDAPMYNTQPTVRKNKSSKKVGEDVQKRYYADKDSINSLRALILIAFVLSITGLYILFIWLHKNYSEYFRIDITTVPEVIIYVFGCLLTIIYVVIAGFILPRWFDSARYSVSFEQIRADTGVIIRSQRRMLMSSVQYITSLRLFDWNAVVIHASGGRMIIPFMSDSDCEDFIKKTEYFLENRGGL